MECFRCYDMKVVDPTVMDSIKQLLIDVYKRLESHDHLADHCEGFDDLIDRVDKHIILLESMPDE